MSVKNVNLELERSGVGMSFRKVAQWVSYSDFTDGGGTSGTLNLTETIPAGSFVIGTKVKVTTAFTGGANTTAVLDIGNSSDADNYTYTDHNIFTAADNLLEPADQVQGGATGGGLVPVTSATTVKLTATVSADWTTISAGRMLVEVFYLSTNPELEVDYPYRNKY